MTTKSFIRETVSYPEDMRTQLWPLCCGAKILSGFKQVASLTEKDMVKQIHEICDEYTPDLQVYAGEQMRPSLTYLTLNSSQWGSPKIRNAVQEAGFKLFATASPRGTKQYFLVRDKSSTFKIEQTAAA